MIASGASTASGAPTFALAHAAGLFFVRKLCYNK